LSTSILWISQGEACKYWRIYAACDGQ